MVGMGVGQQHRVDPVNLGRDQLLAQVGAGVHQQPGRLMRRSLGPALFHYNGAAAAAVFRIFRVAMAPALRHARNARRRAAAKNGDVERHAASGGIFENNLMAFSVVMSASSASSTPLTSASTLRRLRDISRLVGLAAIRRRRQEGRVGLDQKAVERQVPGDVAQF